MKKTEKSEVLIIRARRLKCNTSSHQAVTSPCICPPGNPTLGTGDTNGDTLLCLYNFVLQRGACPNTKYKFCKQLKETDVNYQPTPTFLALNLHTLCYT